MHFSKEIRTFFPRNSAFSSKNRLTRNSAQDAEICDFFLRKKFENAEFAAKQKLSGQNGEFLRTWSIQLIIKVLWIFV